MGTTVAVVRYFAQSGALQRIHVYREHRLAFAFLTGSSGPEASVIAAVLFNFSHRSQRNIFGVNGDSMSTKHCLQRRRASQGRRFIFFPLSTDGLLSLIRKAIGFFWHYSCFFLFDTPVPTQRSGPALFFPKPARWPGCAIRRSGNLDYSCFSLSTRRRGYSTPPPLFF